MISRMLGKGTGIAPVVNLTFPFIDKAHVLATVNGVSAPFTWTGTSQITFNAPIASGTTWKVYRQTPTSPALVDFTNGAVLTEKDLDLAETSHRYRDEELADAITDAAAVDAAAVAAEAAARGAADTAILASVASIPNATARANSRAVLAMMDTTIGAVQLYEAGREGTFVWSSANLSAAVAADPQQGVYVAPTSAPTGASGAWVRVYEGRLKARWFGISGTGSKVTQWNALIAYINAIGNASRQSYQMIGVDFEMNSEIDLRLGGVTPLVVSNVAFYGGVDCRLRLRDGPAFILGSSTVLVDTVHILGFQPTMDVTDIPGAGPVALAQGVNCARIYIADTKPLNLPHLFYCAAAAGKIISGIRLENIFGQGHPNYNWVHLENKLGGTGSSVSLNNVQGYPYKPPTNVAIVPKAITGATAANPVSITCAGHGFLTGNQIRIADVGGMTQLNGNDYTITVVDDNTFTLGVDGTAYTAYTSGGKAAERHWSWQYGDKAALLIDGQWDTVRITNCLFQHWAWMCRYITSSFGPISFTYDSNNIADYIGKGRYFISFSGGSVSHWQIRGGWTFGLDDETLKYEVIGEGAVTDLIMSDHTVGLTGGNILSEVNGRWEGLAFTNIQVNASSRLLNGTKYYFNFAGGATSRPKLNGIRSTDPDKFYGVGSNTFLSPDTGIRVTAACGSTNVSNCLIKANGKHYDIVSGSSSDRVLHGNCRFDGNLPDYALLQIPAVGASPYTFKNTTGLPVNVSIAGGTVVSISLSFVDATDTEIFTAVTGQTSGVFALGRGQSLQLVYSVAPTTFRVYPVL